MHRDAIAGHVSPGIRKLRNIAITVVVLASVLLIGCQAMVRQALFHPTHAAGDNGLAHWTHEGVLIGFARTVPDAENVWLLLHGNGGQAADRVYALERFSDRDAVYIMEYPGYGTRPGKPSRKAFDDAAFVAYEALRAQFPGKPVCVAAESIGSGPASMLARATQPPDKFVFLVPFDDLKSVARDHAPSFLVGMMLGGSWNNVEAMSGYAGAVEVYGAAHDQIIPVDHARKLAASLPQAKYHEFTSGHNDWSHQPQVRIRNP